MTYGQTLRYMWHSDIWHIRNMQAPTWHGQTYDTWHETISSQKASHSYAWFFIILLWKGPMNIRTQFPQQKPSDKYLGTQCKPRINASGCFGSVFWFMSIPTDYWHRKVLYIYTNIYLPPPGDLSHTQSFPLLAAQCARNVFDMLLSFSCGRI